MSPSLWLAVFIRADSFRSLPRLLKKNENALYLSVTVLSTKVLIEDTVFTSPTTGGGTTILRGHPSHLCRAKEVAIGPVTGIEPATSLSTD